MAVVGLKCRRCWRGCDAKSVEKHVNEAKLGLIQVLPPSSFRPTAHLYVRCACSLKSGPCNSAQFVSINNIAADRMLSNAAAQDHEVETASHIIAANTGFRALLTPSIHKAVVVVPKLEDPTIKPKQKQSSMCQHGRKKSQCRTCGGSGFCKHDRLKSRCFACGGSSFCSHGRKRSQCKDCKGSGLCVHLRQKSQCRDCCSFKKLGQLLESGIIPELNPQEPRPESDWESLGNNLFRCM